MQRLMVLPAAAAPVAVTLLAASYMLSDKCSNSTKCYPLQAQHCAMYAAPHGGSSHLPLLGFPLLARVALGLLC